MVGAVAFVGTSRRRGHVARTRQYWGFIDGICGAFNPKIDD